ncbi:MAG: GntR family transcriptional regulator [Candidatus Omnitrophota bacterium]
MLSFSVTFKSGIPIYEQIVFGIKKAIISGQLKPGDSMPSVREISKELRISPITIQKAVSQLVRDNLLETRVGIGTVVSEFGIASQEKKMGLLGDDIGRMIVEARSLGITKKEFIEAIEKQWQS